MENYDFDKVIDRTGTNAVKLEALQRLYGRTDLLPLWVADMDFETPAFITEALRKDWNILCLDIQRNPKNIGL